MRTPNGERERLPVALLAACGSQGAVPMSVSDRIVNMEEGVRESYDFVREHVDDDGRAVLNSLESEHLLLLQRAAFMEAKLREQIREAIGEG